MVLRTWIVRRKALTVDLGLGSDIHGQLLDLHGCGAADGTCRSQECVVLVCTLQSTVPLKGGVAIAD